MSHSKNTKLRKLSKNVDFISWSEEHGFSCLGDYFDQKLSELLEQPGFTQRYYKELVHLVTIHNCQDQFEDFG